jgi:hypothetical protein
LSYGATTQPARAADAARRTASVFIIMMRFSLEWL